MLFGLCSSVNRKVQNSLDEVHRQHDWDFDLEDHKEHRIEEIFRGLNWSNLYDKKAWWDVAGLDRSVRMKLVKRTIREVLTRKKFACVPAVLKMFANQKSVDHVKDQFCFFKRKELEMLRAQPRHPLHDADVTNWKKVVRRPPANCSDPKGWERIMALPQEEIVRFSSIIQSGLHPDAISKRDRQILLSLSRIYADASAQNRDQLPGRMLTLFEACDNSKMILFALERNIRMELSHFQAALNGEHVKELNDLVQNGVAVRPETLGRKPILNKLWKLDDSHFLFQNRSFTLVKHGRGQAAATPIRNNIQSLFAQLGHLTGSHDESLQRAVETLLLEEALIPAGAKPGGLLWQMHALTAPALGDDRVISQKFGSEKWTTEIHDFGGGKVQVIHSLADELQQNPIGIEGPRLGSLKTSFSYSIEKDQESGKYRIGSLTLGDPRFEWDFQRNHPFTSLPNRPNLKEAYAEEIAPMNR